MPGCARTNPGVVRDGGFGVPLALRGRWAICGEEPGGQSNFPGRR